MQLTTTNKETVHRPQTAWLFDIDGVLTNPVSKKITKPEIINQIINRLKKNEPVGFNTGRSLEFIMTQVLNEIENKLDDKTLLANIVAIGEKGALTVTYNYSGIKKVSMDLGLDIPKNIKSKIKELVKKSPYSNFVFYDNTKQTMISLELKTGKNIDEFKTLQSHLSFKIKSILKDQKMETELNIDETKIAIDIQKKQRGKALGARKFVKILEGKGTKPEKYVCFGDSLSDYEMFEELKHVGKNCHFVFVGDIEDLKDRQYSDSVISTQKRYDEGTLEYLKSH